MRVVCAGLLLTGVQAFGCRQILGIETRDSAELRDADVPQAEPPEGAVPEQTSPFCRSLPTSSERFLCVDFDDNQPITAGWYNDPGVDLSMTGGGQRSISTTRWRSAPNSALFSLPALPSVDQSATAPLGQVLPTGTQMAIFSFEAYVDSMSVTGKGAIVFAAVTFRKNRGLITLVQRSEGTSLEVYDGLKQKRSEAGFSNAVPLGRWVRLTLKLDVAPSSAETGEVTAFVEGAMAKLTVPPEFAIDEGNRVAVALGPVAAIGPTGPFRMYADNVFIERR
jgi:hypothetical protein